METEELLLQLLSIDSQNPPGNEKEIAYFIKDFLEDTNFEVELIEFAKNRYDVVASRGEGKGIMMEGHLDTVPIVSKKWKIDGRDVDPFGERINGKIYGRGAVDMKGPIACILSAVKKLRNEKFKRRLLLVFVGDEEVKLRGSTFLVKNRKDIFNGITHGIVAEPTNFKVSIAQKGIFNFIVKFKGRAAHASIPELGDNAIYKACEFIQALRRLENNLKKNKHALLGTPTINVGVIKGGTKVNIVPDYCEVGIDRRVLPNEDFDNILDQIKKILSELRLDANIEITLKKRPMEIKEDSFVKRIKEIANAEVIGLSGYTEAEIFYRELGIKCVVFGPGNINLAHTTQEHISIEDLKKGTIIFEKIIREFCM